jgi:hypothetical protein
MYAIVSKEECLMILVCPTDRFDGREGHKGLNMTGKQVSSDRFVRELERRIGWMGDQG